MGYPSLIEGNDHESCEVDEIGRGFTKSEGLRVKRCVHFGDVVMVFLIPSRREYRDAGLVPVLWWVRSDFANFKEAAILARECDTAPSRPLKRDLSHSLRNENDSD